MFDDDLPKSDLKQLRDEVLSKHPEAALPVNLPDHWLDMLARDLDEVFEVVDDVPSSNASAPLALILHTIQGKTSNERVEISFDTLYRYFHDLRAEIHLEIISRRTNFRIEPATLETIFTNPKFRVANVTQNVPDGAGDVDWNGCFAKSLLGDI